MYFQENFLTFKFIIENLDDPICIIDLNSNFRIEWINREAFSNILGYKYNVLIGKSVLSIIDQDDVKIFKENLNKRHKSNYEKYDLGTKYHFYFHQTVKSNGTR